MCLKGLSQICHLTLVLSKFETKLEDVLVKSHIHALNLEESIITPEFCLELGTISASFATICATLLNRLKSEVLSMNDQIKKISSVDIEISLHDPAELWNTSVIDKHVKKLDKNSKNYEEEKWAMEQQAKLDAKKGIKKLTKEQIEAKKKEMEKEAEVRAKHLPCIVKFKNGISILNSIVNQHREIKLEDQHSSLYEALSELAEQIFTLLGSSLFDSSALQMLRSLTGLVSRQVAPYSWSNAIVSFSARLSHNASLEGKLYIFYSD